MKIGPPNLQELVTAAGGFGRITPEMWAAVDQAMEVYHRARRELPTNNKSARDDLGTEVPEQSCPSEGCIVCGGEAEFGYRDAAGELQWFCALHRLAKYWADARREVDGNSKCLQTTPERRRRVPWICEILLRST
jgi:hypothetical protein